MSDDGQGDSAGAPAGARAGAGGPFEPAASLNTWQELARDGLAELQRSSLALWERSREFRSYCTDVVSTPLQTPEYAHALLTGVRDRLGTIDDVDEAVAARMARQELWHDPKRQYTLVVEERALRSVVDSPATMAGQLDHLLEAMSAPNLTLAILPLAHWVPFASQSFYLFDDAVMHTELLTRDVEITDPEEIQLYATLFDDLLAAAVQGDEARALLRAARVALGT